MLTVASVYWEGEFRERPYTAEWVRKLRNMARRKVPEHRFVVLSNVDVEGVETIPLIHDWPGWWSKVELFRPGLFEGRVVFYDLDVLLTDDQTPLFEGKEPFKAMPVSQHWKRQPNATAMFYRNAEGKTVVQGIQSSVMAWTPGQGAERIYERFDPSIMERLRGDQDWIGSIMPDAATFPAEWFCKLRFCTEGPPAGSKVILSMPWKCEEAASKFEWVRDLWT